MPALELSEMMDRIAMGLENVTKSVSAADELLMSTDKLKCFLSVFRVH
jgi:hypothetical protein